MHPVVSHEVAKSRAEDLQRQAAARRRARAAWPVAPPHPVVARAQRAVGHRLVALGLRLVASGARSPAVSQRGPGYG